MKILALDSSGLVASVALVEDQTLVGEYTIQYKKTHSQTLLPMLAQLRDMVELDMTSVDAIAIAAGPGSFTGLRIGSATVKGLGLALEKPIVEVPTLEALAYNLYGSKALVCPIMDARRNQVYTGVYGFEKEENQEFLSLKTVLPQCPMDIEVLIDWLNKTGEEVTFLGDGVPVYQNKIREKCEVAYQFAPASVSRQRAASVATIGALYYARGKVVDAAAHEPEYLRLSQAERERQEPEIVPLTKEDVLQVVSIERECFSQPWSEDGFCQELEREHTLFLVAKVAGKVAGYCGLVGSLPEGEITNVAVKTPYRRQNIGEKLLQKLLDMGQEMGVKDFTLEVRKSNQPAIGLYEKLGFVSEGIRPGFYELPKEDAVIMWKRTENHEGITTEKK